MKLKSHFSLLLLITAFFIVMLASCKKNDDFITSSDASISFSSDSVVFDTVFTTIGSVTRQLRLYNKHNQKIRISRIFLKEGSGSQFRINIDGTPALDAKDIEIEANDSLFVFVKVTVNPNDDLSPFVVSDQIICETNGNTQTVELIAWGQNAYYIVADRHIGGFPPFKIVAHEYSDTTWDNQKPFLIYGYAVIDSNAVLRIQEGTSIHFHSNSGLWVYKGGSVIVNGTFENPVTFQGDRLGIDYSDMAGQWDRIWINEGSNNNVFNYAIIKNGFIGIQAETLQENMGNQLVLNNTIIENMTGFGLFSRFYNIEASNLLIAGCEIYGVALTLGGTYNFKQCTFANYWDQSLRQTPNLFMNNYYLDTNNQVVPFHFDAYFGNCINFGKLDEEMEFDFEEGAIVNYLFENCLLKTELNTNDPNIYNKCIINQDPLFVDTGLGNYHPDSLSPLIDKAGIEIASQVPYDLDQVYRLPNPDIGAYEFTGGK